MNGSVTETFEVFRCLKTNKVACYGFIDTGRRHKTPEPQMKESVLLSERAIPRVLACVIIP